MTEKAKEVLEYAYKLQITEQDAILIINQLKEDLNIYEKHI